jgi:hypothetical protein
MLAMNWLLAMFASSAAAFAATSASSASRSSVMSVFVPNQPISGPSASPSSGMSRMGTARERNQRYAPSARRRGKVSSQDSPAAIAAAKRSTTRSTWSGWWTERHPQPAISSGGAPV